MEVLGHRGSRTPGPENTVEAVDAALRAGADGVELDIRRSADGDLVCVHDARLPRLGGRAVIRRSTRELASRGIPVLTDVLDVWAGRGRLILEIKNQPGQPDFDAPRERTARALIELLRARGLPGPGPATPGPPDAVESPTGDPGEPRQDPVPDARADGGGPGAGSASQPGITVSSFDWFAIEAVRDAGLGIATAFLTMPRMSVSGGIAYVRSAGHTELHAHVSAVRGVPDAVPRARRAGVRLVTWTVTDPAAALELRDAGVDGIICDDPAGITTALGR
ncbi:glycerophosphodiester phosphodiesterase [Parafrankia colletiae]|uniref:Glycerophosphodiester phosphodiesterase n=1 Tax=Parafrankia colletiae TaxID=573497 RepID=A0A1S1QB02_9ACTN|nr:glycerophosphodiester phosphodiesterase [Parafrankia colletiae]MCK9899705.1 glycerophosphodiester phosphodiesterase [Frankia sp. Cpl3]OHV30641.1 glycerophosphodiester phosphodiesterase [Parafrankia colletiae]